MGFLKYDSPVMEFISSVVDFIILNVLWIICCIPIITIGAATSAKYAGSMRILRGEDNPVFKSFFKDFKDNFKQATQIWLVLLAVVALVAADWLWMNEKGINTIPTPYMIAIVVLTIAVIGVYMSIFAFIARFTVTTKEAWKGGVLFSLLHIVQLALIAGIEIGTFIACFWYMRYLPGILLFGTTTAFYFNTLLLVKEFGRAEEAKFGSKETDEQDEEGDGERSSESDDDQDKDQGESRDKDQDESQDESQDKDQDDGQNDDQDDTKDADSADEK